MCGGMPYIDVTKNPSTYIRDMWTLMMVLCGNTIEGFTTEQVCCATEAQDVMAMIWHIPW
jgi:hypothetical protein